MDNDIHLPSALKRGDKKGQVMKKPHPTAEPATDLAHEQTLEHTRHERRDRNARSLRVKSKSLVLVVDDAPINIEVMRGILEAAGYEVQAACDGAMALQMALTNPPQLILLDVVMPGMDGYAVCQQLKQNEATRHIPVIFVTGMDDIDAEAQGFALGAADYITRPIRVPVVLARVKAHLALYGQRRHLEGMFRDIMEFAPDAFILSDRQGNVVQINVRAEQLFGYRREELNGLPAERLIPQRLRGQHEDYRHRTIRHLQRPMTSLSIQCLRKDGSEFPGDINLSPLETNRGRLLMAVVRDVSERQRAALELRESRQRLRELAAQNEATREAERKHIAREVHDELGQVLTALRMDLSLLRMHHGATDPTLTNKLVDMKGLVDRAIQGVRNVAMNLRPTALDMGLGPAIEWLCSDFTGHTGVACLFHVKDEHIELDEARAVVVFRIVQESLTNISRYAQASRVDVSLKRRNTELHLEVRDNGRGFDLAEAGTKKSFGLLGMRERALALGGQVQIASTPGQGTVIRVAIPLDDIAKELP